MDRSFIINQKPSIHNPAVLWFSGGVTSAVACKRSIEMYGKDRCRIIFIDTGNESDDTYQFLKDCSAWYGVNIETIANKKYSCIQDVWDKYLGLNFANGAICSSELKRAVRIEFQKKSSFACQVFGFDIREPRRAESMKLNYPESRPVFPLLFYAYSKGDCIKILEQAGIKIPISYRQGYLNNNCFKTGCVQGGIGYWQKIKEDDPAKFDTMAEKEHELTDKKGYPVTMLKDQSNEAKKLVKTTGIKTLQFVFLKPHPNYPHIKDISMLKGRKPKPLVECNGFCGVDDTSEENSASDLNLVLWD